MCTCKRTCMYMCRTCAHVSYIPAHGYFSISGSWKKFYYLDLPQVGVVCARLQTLDVSGSLEVTSIGIHAVLSGGSQTSLLSTDLTRTGSDQVSLGYILSRAKRLRCLRADQNVWEEFLNCCNSRYVPEQHILMMSCNVCNSYFVPPAIPIC